MLYSLFYVEKFEDIVVKYEIKDCLEIKKNINKIVVVIF